ncbi:MAG: hypothetical protein ACI8O8_002151 [Oleiphilaceae bacterium]
MKNIPPTKNPNPQGKGLVTVLQEIDSRQLSLNTTSHHSLTKTLHDYALSRLVLCAEFNFKPVANKPYYLYVKDKTLKLSLVAPNEWRDSGFGFYICQCLLESTMFWSFSNKSDEPNAVEYLALAVEPLKDTLLSDFFSNKPLEETLPYYDERLPFHRRVLANALASQITNSIPKALSKSLKQLGKENSHQIGQIPFLMS